MSELRIYPDSQPETVELVSDHAAISERLQAVGVLFERWEAQQPLSDTATPDDVMAAYQADIDRLMNAYGFQSVDVISMYPEHPDKAALRDKFLHEHTHSEYEVRFFVAGQGLFSLHIDGQVYGVLCEQGDLISVPAGVTHWFDMGPNPTFKAIRLFSTPEGWVANFTGNDIANHFPRLEAV